MTSFRVGQRLVGDAPTYFIADISANHDGQLARAVDLIHLAAASGASAAKFQNFRAAHIVSDKGFRDLGNQVAHQASWKRSVTEVYQDASLPWEWTPTLKAECDRAGIDYFSTPYDLEAVEMLAPYVEIFKIGSGDITWLEMVRAVARSGKPVLLATGASEMDDVVRAVDAIREAGVPYGLMQCNTNYTGSLENFRHIHLNVLRTFADAFPDAVLGLSDHTPGHATVLGAVTLGARVVEKHFTDDTTREGPDHPFSMTPTAWREMVDRTRELELALGDATKSVAENERQTHVVQRRSLRATRDLAAGSTLAREDLEPLRPSPAGSVPPYALSDVLGRRLARPLARGDALSWDALEEL
ncbi:MAG TPA: N-acetylneuraminate synthase family protein [Gemmatimonadaceae bacterium]|jgi:N-acetylneuraminate synthase|nr:N-acetylneuraminate synthase family protein [Gemmatimonadaceae bacterium]